MIKESTASREAGLNGRLTFLSAGTGTAAVRIYGGTRPAFPTDAPGSAMLVAVTLTNPPGTVASGQLSLTATGPATVVASGTATWARVINENGDAAFDMDVGLTGSGAELILTQTQLFVGGQVSITSAVLS